MNLNVKLTLMLCPKISFANNFVTDKTVKITEILKISLMTNFKTRNFKT